MRSSIDATCGWDSHEIQWAGRGLEGEELGLPERALVGDERDGLADAAQLRPELAQRLRQGQEVALVAREADVDVLGQGGGPVQHCGEAADEHVVDSARRQ